MIWAFSVSGLPKGQPRPRAFAFHGKARMYDPGTAEGWKASVADAAARAGVKAAGPVKVELAFFMPRPKSHYGKHGVKPSAPFHHAQKPDVDNLAKAVLDALTAISCWQDDAMVCKLYISREWTIGNGGCGITIEEL